MNYIFEAGVNGLSLGFIYALLALGFVIVYKATHVINLAHGSIMLVGIYVAAELSGRVGFGLGVIGGIAAAGAVAVAAERLLIQPLRRRGAGFEGMIVMTIGLDIILMVDLTTRIGPRLLDIGGPWGSAVVSLGAVSVPLARIIAMLVVVAIVVIFYLALKFTPWGIAMRAAAQDTEATALMGIRLDRVSMGAWLLAGAMAVIAGVFLTSFPSPGFSASVGLVALNAFPAAIIGGLSSTHGALIGGILTGVVETFVTSYGDLLGVWGEGLGAISPWILMMIVLLVKPAGLFGEREVARV